MPDPSATHPAAGANGAAQTLAAQTLAARAGNDVLVADPSTRLLAGDAGRLQPAAGIGTATVALVSIRAPVTLVEVLLALDGRVAALLLVSAASSAEVVARLAAAAGTTCTISDRDDLAGALHPHDALRRGADRDGHQLGGPHDGLRDGAATATADMPLVTAWLMTTSGTTGQPKIVPHTLASLSRSVRRRSPEPKAPQPVWGLLYEMTRFAGLQVALQSLIGGGRLVAVPHGAALGEQVDILAGAGTTHLSATPTLWRRLMMVPHLDRLPVRQITMGGEIADQAVLDAVGRRFPAARLTHIYASTEAGVGFAVNDRKAGFPRDYTERPPGDVRIAVRDGMLWLRPPDRRMPRYLDGRQLETDGDGYVNTGDRVQIRGDRVFFLGRDGGMINVGGVKVWPEQVEAVITAVPGVALAQVGARKNPITGALLTATVLPADPAADRDALRDAILAACRSRLEREAVPSRIAFAERIETNAAGKISRT